MIEDILEFAHDEPVEIWADEGLADVPMMPFEGER